MIAQFEQNQRDAIGKKLRELMENWRAAHPGEKLTDETLGKAIRASREAVNGWKNGKTFPSGDYLSDLCSFFGVPPTFFDQAEDELIYTDEQRHRDLDQLCRRTADHIGLRESLVQFIKETPALADLVASVSWVHSVVNPPDSKVPDHGSAFQYVSSSGARFYLPDDVLYMLRCVQRDLEDYAAFLVRKYSGLIVDAHKAPAGTDHGPSPVVRFALDLDGMASLSPDESSMVSIMRLLDEKGKVKLAEYAAHIAHDNRKEKQL